MNGINEMSTSPGLTSGQLAKAAGVGVETIRFYEKEGILDAPARTRAGYRMYDSGALQRIQFVHQAQSLGFTLREIRELLALDRQPDAECDDLRDRTVDKLRVVGEKIAELQRMHGALSSLLASCEAGQPLRDCPVMKGLTTKE